MGKRFDKMLAKVKEYDPELTDEQARQEAQDWIEEEDQNQVAEDEAIYGPGGRPVPEDSPTVQSADLWNTGEGQFHGLI